MITSADSIVVCSSASAAVLWTDSARLSSISFASLPMERARSRIGTTRATTTSTTMMVIV